MTIIRKFKRSDIFPVMRLVNETFEEDYSPEILFSFHKNWEEGFLVAEENNSIVGLIVGSISLHEQARILILAVEKLYRGKGIGTELLRAFFQECLGKSIKKVSLEVRVSNLAAIEFYKRHGFSITQLITRYYRDGEDGYVMYKLLQ